MQIMCVYDCVARGGIIKYAKKDKNQFNLI